MVVNVIIVFSFSFPHLYQLISKIYKLVLNVIVYIRFVFKILYIINAGN